MWSRQTNWVNLEINAFSPVNPDRSRPHTLGILANRDELSLYFDGALLGSVRDKTFSEGIIAFYGEAGDDPVILSFDNLRVWHLAEE